MNTLPQDPFILLSYINTKLRDDYSSLQTLCNDLDIDIKEVEGRLAAIGYVYNPALNTFK